MRTHESRFGARAIFVLLLGLAASLLPAAPPVSEWSPPVNLGPSINSAFSDASPALSKDGLSLYFTSGRPGGMGGNDIWVSQRSSREDPWSEPVNLGPTVNTAFNEDGASFSRDMHTMYFNSDRPGGFGLRDIWISERAHTGDDLAWEEPVNAGPGVNSSAGDAGAGYLENEDVGTPLLYFGSNRSGGPGLSDIYVSAQAAVAPGDRPSWCRSSAVHLTTSAPTSASMASNCSCSPTGPAASASPTSGSPRAKPTSAPGRLRSTWAPR